MKAFTDLEQSKKLAVILPLESADMYYEWPNKMVHFKDDKYNGMGISCWSLAALLDILPVLERKGYQRAKPQLLYNVAINKWIVDSHIYTTDAYDNQVDACVDMIIKLHELKKL